MEEKKYFRIGTLFSAILHILLGLVIGATALILVVGFSQAVTNGDTASSIAWVFMGGWFLQIFIMLIGVTLMIMTIVIGSKEIRMISMNPVDYKNKTGKIIGHLVYDAIMLVLLIFIAFLFSQDESSAWIMFFCVGEASAFGLAFAGLLSSKINFSVKVKKGKITQEELNPQRNNQNTNIGGNSVFQQKSPAENLEQELVKLKELKDKGLLSEEEYEAQRKIALEKYSK